jgi:two-component system response regulator PilR (NtrC family)
VARVEREYLNQALKEAHGVKTRAAERLGLTFRQFRYLLKKYENQGS